MKNINIYLADGSYDGVITMNSPLSKFTVARITRNELPNYSATLEGTGLYFLLIGKSSVYVGQSSLDYVSKRILNTHSKDIDSSWHTVVGFINTGALISNNELLYMENALCEYAHQNYQVCLTSSPAKDNCNEKYRSKHYGLSIGQINSCKAYIEDIKYYIQCFPKTIFPEKIPVEDPEPPVEKVKLYIHSVKREAHAEALYAYSGKIKVLKDSMISSSSNLPNQKKQGGMEKMRQKLIEDGIVVNRKFVTDYEFSSPSTAAAVILGTASSGNEKWKDENGVSLGELKENAKA